MCGGHCLNTANCSRFVWSKHSNEDSENKNGTCRLKYGPASASGAIPNSETTCGYLNKGTAHLIVFIRFK